MPAEAQTDHRLRLLDVLPHTFALATWQPSPTFSPSCTVSLEFRGCSCLPGPERKIKASLFREDPCHSLPRAFQGQFIFLDQNAYLKASAQVKGGKSRCARRYVRRCICTDAYNRCVVSFICTCYSRSAIRHCRGCIGMCSECSVGLCICINMCFIVYV